jgi:hypothetical protein
MSAGMWMMMAMMMGVMVVGIAAGAWTALRRRVRNWRRR